MSRRLVPSLLAIVAFSSPLLAQGHQHTPGMTHPTAATTNPPTQGGQAAFAAISEIVARLDADQTTDWNKVNIEALRQHLIDMDLVTMQSRVASREVPGGFEADVTGTDDVTAAIRRMTRAHFSTLGDSQGFSATVTEIANGVRVRVVASDAGDARAAARLRGLGVIGLLTLDNHHAPHHEAMARGSAMHH